MRAPQAPSQSRRRRDPAASEKTNLNVVFGCTTRIRPLSLSSPMVSKSAVPEGFSSLSGTHPTLTARHFMWIYQWECLCHRVWTGRVGSAAWAKETWMDSPALQIIIPAVFAPSPCCENDISFFRSLVFVRVGSLDPPERKRTAFEVVRDPP